MLTVFEDCELFNAGNDSVFTSTGDYAILHVNLRDSAEVKLDHSYGNDLKFGRVEALAVVSEGNRSAATSTVGMTIMEFFGFPTFHHS